MFKKLALLSVVLILIFTGAMAQIQQVKEEGAGISARLQHEINITKDPMLGYVPKNRLINAIQERKQRIERVANRSALFTWTERGPNSDVTGPSNGNTRLGNGITSGRVRAVWEDLGDATGRTVWVGGIDQFQYN